MMDFLDPTKRRAHTIRLFIGYFLVAIAIGLGTLILVYQAKGFNYDNKTHSVVQNGLLFLDAKPEQAAITLNGTLRHEKTNVRLGLPEGSYAVKLSHAGYRPWQRDVTLEGGTVQRYDYPLLFPEKIATTEAEVYPSAPVFVTQSPDKRWLFTQLAGDPTTFSIRDLNAIAAPPVALKVPPELYSFPAGSLKIVEWASDNQHFLAEHTDGAQTEFIMVDRSAPAESININRVLGVTPSKVVVRDGHWDQLYTFEAAGGLIRSADLKARLLSGPILTNVLAFKPQGADVLLYITGLNAPAGKVFARLYTGSKTVTLREITASSAGTYFVDATKYDNHNYYIIASPADNKAQVFRDPLSREVRTKSPYVAPYTVLRLASPQKVTVAYGGRFIATQSGPTFVVFDLETAQTFRYNVTDTLAGDKLALWMDNYRLMLHTDQGIKVMDYDGTNQQTLMAAASDLPVYIDKDTETMYSFNASPQVPRYTLQRSVLKIVPTPQ